MPFLFAFFFSFSKREDKKPTFDMIHGISHNDDIGEIFAEPANGDSVRLVIRGLFSNDTKRNWIFSPLHKRRGCSIVWPLTEKYQSEGHDNGVKRIVWQPADDFTIIKRDDIQPVIFTSIISRDEFESLVSSSLAKNKIRIDAADEEMYFHDLVHIVVK